MNDSPPSASPLETMIGYAGDASVPQTRFDLALFKELNAEYANKQVVAAPRPHTDGYHDEIAAKRGKTLERKIGIKGLRLLEIGCGEGHLSRALSRDFDCDMVGVDINTYPSWSAMTAPRLTLLKHDICTDDNARLGLFDRVISFAVFEHIVHPHAALKAVHSLLKPGGKAYIYANLYRGAKASHRYREVFFPWPHLLFGPDVWRAFYTELTGEALLPAWVNKWTYDSYVATAGRLGFAVIEHFTSPPFFDEAFYQRFEYWLGAYPVFDLKHDFIHLILQKPLTA